jgi:glycolate dehydrogenase iron-sulfur subunit
MHTELSTAHAHSSAAQRAKAIIGSCVHCGFCLPTCPTYQLLGNELDSPRGRIYLIKQMLEGARATEVTVTHLDRCLTCRACETACPSGVQYGQLVDIGRQMLDSRAIRSPSERLLRSALGAALSRRSVFAAALRAGRWLRPLLPRAHAERIPAPARVTLTPAPRHARRMVVLRGCVQPALAPNINAAAARVLDRLGVSLVTAAADACCGALSHHLSATERALRQARRNIDAWTDLLDGGAEAILMTASGCGVMVKDYALLLHQDPKYRERAARVSAATRDLCEVLSVEDIATLTRGKSRASGYRVAWQSPCTLQHGQRLTGRVEPLLEAAGFSLTAVPEPHLCCGSAGTYAILQPALAVRLRAAKLTTLQAASPEVIATANIGCLQHLSAASEVPVKHWIELIDEVSAAP